MSERVNLSDIRERRRLAAIEADELTFDLSQNLFDLIYEDVAQLCDEVERLTKLIDTPHTKDFMEAVPLEAAHQLKRWGVEHDTGKTPEDWFWLIGYLAGKALHHAKAGNTKKAKHHTISTAAVLLNWHRRLTGDDSTFRPGIEPPAESEAANA